MDAGADREPDAGEEGVVMPVVVRAVEVTIPEAGYLADLYGVADDLDFAERILSTAISLDGKHGFDSDIWTLSFPQQSFGTAAVFKSGVERPSAPRPRLAFRP